MACRPAGSRLKEGWAVPGAGAEGVVIDGNASPVPEVEVRRAEPGELVEAVGVTARAFRDNPMTVACWGSDPARRERGLEMLFGEFLPALAAVPFVAMQGRTVVGMLGLAPPGSCSQAPLGPTWRVFRSMLLTSPRTANRFRQWMVRYERHEPTEAHWHLGPVAVEPSLQHRGIGRALLGRFCEEVDDDGTAAYLETDRAANALLYERYGFRTIAQERILQIDNWFMRRSAQPWEATVPPSAPGWNQAVESSGG